MENNLIKQFVFGGEVFGERRRVFMGFETNTAEVMESQIDDDTENDKDELKLSSSITNAVGENVKSDESLSFWTTNDTAKKYISTINNDFKAVLSGKGGKEYKDEVVRIYKDASDALMSKYSALIETSGRLNKNLVEDSFKAYISLIKGFDKEMDKAINRHKDDKKNKIEQEKSFIKKDNKKVENTDSKPDNGPELIKQEAFSIDGINTEVRDGKFYIYSKDGEHGNYFTIPKDGKNHENDKFMKDGRFNKKKIKKWAKGKVDKWKEVKKPKPIEKKDTFESVRKDYLKNVQGLFVNLKEKKDSNDYDKGEIKKVTDSLKKIQLKIIKSKTVDEVQDNAEDYISLADRINNLSKKKTTVENVSENDGPKEKNLENLDSLEDKINKIIDNIDDFTSSSAEKNGENVIGKIDGKDVILYQRQIGNREAILKGDYTKFDTQYVLELDGDDKGFFGSDTETIISTNEKPDFDKVKIAMLDLDKKSKEK